MNGISTVSRSASGSARAGGGRLRAIDATRGLAVLAMIEWHTADAWLDEGARRSAAFGWAELVGGLAAPAFVLLAGLSLALATPERPSLARTLVSVRRGAVLVVAGYGLRLYSWSIDHGALLEREARGPAIAAALGLAMLASALSERERARTVRGGLALAGVASLFAAWTALGAVAPGSAAARLGLSLLSRLDVLHGIGGALIASALALHASARIFHAPRSRIAALAACAAAIAALSPSLRGVPQSAMPAWIAGWIAQGPGAAFPLLPWLAYALVGAALALASRARPAGASGPWSLPHVARPERLFVGCAIVAVIASDTRGAGTVLVARVPELVSLVRLAFNVAAIVGAAAALAALLPRRDEHVAAAPARSAIGDALALLGRRSLIVYAAHLELAYGLAGTPLRRALGLELWAIGAIALAVAMIALARAAERASRGASERSPRAVHATA